MSVLIFQCKDSSDSSGEDDSEVSIYLEQDVLPVLQTCAEDEQPEDRVPSHLVYSGQRYIVLLLCRLTYSIKTIAYNICLIFFFGINMPSHAT